ncbi:MAG: heme ABC exporter ATP-binding protein CcmA [Gemmatimonadetes bacterium]|nr:heme ABC exporter ATP-binding protein CcmA [Gemmatimonadota bacterium]
MKTALRVEGLTRRFGRRWALRGIDLEVEAGSVVALLGSNGTGKTTLLRVLSTLLRPTAGTVEVLGCALPDGGAPVRERAAFMTSEGHLYEELTGRENLRFTARMHGLTVERERVSAALAEVGLEDAADTTVRAYSTGMRKRLELARIGLRPVELVLLDEPFASLDDDGVAIVQRSIAGWKGRGATVIVASHRVAQASRCANRLVRLVRGVVGEDAPS